MAATAARPGRPEHRHPDRRGDRDRDPAAQGLAPVGTGGPGRSALGGGPERVVGALRGRRDRPPAAERAGVRETGPARGRTRPGGGRADTNPGTGADSARDDRIRGEGFRGGIVLSQVAPQGARPVRGGLSRRARDGKATGLGSRAVFWVPCYLERPTPVQTGEIDDR